MHETDSIMLALVIYTCKNMKKSNKYEKYEKKKYMIKWEKIDENL